MIALAAILLAATIGTQVNALHHPDFDNPYFTYRGTNDGSSHRRISRDVSFTNSENGTTEYETEFIELLSSKRNPDRVLFKAIIHDNAKHAHYPVGINGSDELLAFKSAPDGAAYSFVLDDNVYYAPSPEQPPIKISNREKDGLIHGTFDWVYNEEIFGRGSIRDGAMWFSPSGKYLAYASRAVNSSEKILMTSYARDEKYNYNYNMEYPKTGDKRIAEFSVSIWSVKMNKSIRMDVHLKDHKSFHYLFGVSWVTIHGKERLLTTWANRWQNETSLTLCDYEKGACSLIYEHKYKHGQWAEMGDYSNIVHSYSSFFFRLPHSIGNNSWQHIAKISLTPALKFKSISFIPSGEYDIGGVVAYRHAEDVVFYLAQAPHPWHMHVYASPAGKRSLLKADQCITCSYSNCTFQIIPYVSKADKLTIELWCQGPSEPYNAIFKPIISHDPTGKFEYIFANSSEEDPYKPAWKIETFVLENGYEAIVQIFEGDLNLTSIPVTFFVYGGPGFNQVSDYVEPFSQKTSFKQAIVHIDVRGSGGRGWNYRSQIYGRMVTVEVEDTYEAMRIVLAKYPRLDRNRVGVYGWSYGGTMATALVEFAPDGFFKCAAAGAPVTNFALYDATYTERYMADTPLSAYTDLTLNVTKFAHTNLLLVHGLRDDNVHFQHSALLIEALQNAEIQFRLMVYPNKDHGLNFRSKHWDTLFDNFFRECYDPIKE